MPDPNAFDKAGLMKPLFSWRGAICESDLPPDARLVALVLSLHANARCASAFPGAFTLQHDTGLSLRQVRYMLAELERRGWLTAVSRGGLRGEKKTATVYELTSPHLVDNTSAHDAPVQAVQRPVHTATATGAHGAHQDVTPKTETEDAPAPEPWAFDKDAIAKAREAMKQSRAS